MKLGKPRGISLPTGVLGLTMSPDGRRLYAACMDGQIFAVDPVSGAAKPFLTRHASFASGCALLPDGKTLISGGYDGALIWHHVKSREQIHRVQAHDFWSWQMALSPDGSRVASVTGQYLVGGEKYEPAPAAEPTVKVFDAQSGASQYQWDLLPPVLSVVFSPDSRNVAAANLMGDVRIWDAIGGQNLAQFNSPDFTSWGVIKSHHYCGGICGLAFAPDGQSLLCCGMGPVADPMSANGKMTWQRWAWKESPPRLLEQIHEGECGSGLMEAFAYSPDGSMFVLAGHQAQGTWSAGLFSATDGKLLASMPAKGRLTRVLFSADGRTLYISAVIGQPKRDEQGNWPDYGRIHVVEIKA